MKRCKRADGQNKIDGALYDVIITDIKMPNIDGIEVLRHAHRVSPDSAVILITAVDDYEAAVEAVKAGGATDYIRKSPGLVDEIKLAMNRALEKLNLSKQNFALRRDAATRNSLDNIIGSSGAMEKLKQTVRIVASTASTVLIHGESGTGKELVARAVHVCSPRATDSFVSVNCGAFPETLLESELFGYLKGAFTGANQNKRGLFEVADGGTIFLDEISEMTLAMQVKLLRVLQERTVRPVGSTSEISIDVRVIAATNRDLDKAVAENLFREDLYYRLNVIPIRVPPLRERPEDIPLLVNHFLKKYASAAGRSILRCMRRRSIPCAATSGREMFANWKIRWNAPSPSKPPTNCTWSFQPSARKRVPPPPLPEARSRKSVATSLFPKVWEWKTTWPASSARCCRTLSTRAAASRPKPPMCSASPTARFDT